MRTVRFPFRPLLAALLAALGTGLAPALHAESLPMVMDKVLLQQPGVRSAQALLRAAEAQVTQVRSDFLPSLGLTYRNSDSRDETSGRPIDRNVRRSDASLRWNLFNGGTDTYRLRGIELSREAADADLDEVLERVAYEITESYTDVVRLRQSRESLDASIVRQERLAAKVAQRVEAGRIAAAELDLIEGRLIQSRTLLGQLRAQLGSAEYRYRLITGEAPDNLVAPAIAPAARDGDVEALVERIQERNPRLRAALQRAAARQADVGAARGSFFPAVDLSYSKRLDNTTIPVPVSDTDRAAQVQVSLDIPLGGRNLGRHSEAVERYQAAQADADEMLQKVSRDLTDLSRQLAEARAIAPSAEARVLAAQRVAAAYELHFDAGRRSLNDVALVQDDLFNAQRALIENHAQQTTLQAQLLGMAGELRDSLKSRYRPAPLTPELLGSAPPPAALPAPAPVAASVTAAVAAVAAPAAPAPPPATAPAPALAGVPERLEAWAAAWAAQDFDAYRAFYRRDFQPGKGRSTEAWEAERRQRLGEAHSPSVRIAQLQLQTRSAERISARFVQHYSAGNYRDTVKKQLDWVKVDGEWKISAETVLAPPAAPPATELAATP